MPFASDSKLRHDADEYGLTGTSSCRSSMCPSTPAARSSSGERRMRSFVWLVCCKGGLGAGADPSVSVCILYITTHPPIRLCSGAFFNMKTQKDWLIPGTAFSRSLSLSPLVVARAIRAPLPVPVYLIPSGSSVCLSPRPSHPPSRRVSLTRIYISRLASFMLSSPISHACPPPHTLQSHPLQSNNVLNIHTSLFVGPFFCVRSSS